ncbi:MAG: CoA-binding protein [Chloroflexi bacterium]|nr:CoA-binding protein [Chloroflexota bacterium]
MVEGSDEARLADRGRAADILDLQEGRGSVSLLDQDQVLDLLTDSRRICIVGASPDRARPSNSVMRYLQHFGYECVPVNPYARDVLGIPCHASIEDAVAATGSFDIIDVFRRPEHTPAVAESAVATGARALWLQLGVVNWEAARIAHDGGLGVVMDRCTAIEHRRVRARR